jgi:predicted RNA binding protein YcfA (HicA-like mRNA interferase family)
MTRLPRVSGRQCCGAPGKVGFRLVREHASHIVLRRLDPFAQVVVPDHRELDRGTLRPSLGTLASASRGSSACSPAEARSGPANPGDPQ